ncbi:MAG TPA: endonuclease MutS2 [Haloplasmataceae bacterium]
MNAITKILEFDKIIAKLITFTHCSLGEEEINNIEILNDIEIIQKNLDETDEALKLLYQIGDIPFGGISDIRPFVKRAQINGVLDVSELIQIADFIYGVNLIKDFLRKIIDEKITCNYICNYINGLIDLNNLRKEIEKCIDIHGQIIDDATLKLKQIRNEIKTMELRVKDKLNQILMTQKEYLTDTIITIRNDRYVVPVKVEFKNKFGGIIHDMSQSGNTVYIEPRQIVEMNNKVSSLKHDELEEVNKILKALTISVSQYGEELLNNVELVKRIDFIFAKAKFAKENACIKPIINDEGRIKIFKGRHPLIDPIIVVPNDIFLGESFNTMIITGPNTGGKTVTLKTLGLFTLMMQAGLLVPANEQTELAVFDNIFADIGDEQSIEQSLSTFSSHMKNIIYITDHITINSLVLLDELGAGTDPKEGAALAISLLNYLGERGARIIATTHYSELKTYAFNKEKVINASVEFNIDTLKPTYKLLIGIPGRSNALDISRRLGLNEKIVEMASLQLETENTDVSKLIIQLENQGLYLDKLVTENEELKQKLLSEIADYEKKQKELIENKEEIIDKARKEAQDIVRKAQKEVNEIINELKELKRTKQADYKEHEVIDIKGKLSKLEYYDKEAKVSTTYKELQPGNTVKVLSLNRVGQLVEKVNDDEWLVQIGILSSRINEKNLELINTNEPHKEATSQISVKKNSQVLLELDLRGERYEEALIKLDKYLDSAVLNNYHQVTIIHGHGTGTLRQAVHDYLKKCKYVKSFRLGGEGEGGVGVTVVTFH